MKNHNSKDNDRNIITDKWTSIAISWILRACPWSCCWSSSSRSLQLSLSLRTSFGLSSSLTICEFVITILVLGFGGATNSDDDGDERSRSFLLVIERVLEGKVFSSMIIIFFNNNTWRKEYLFSHIFFCWMKLFTSISCIYIGETQT